MHRRMSVRYGNVYVSCWNGLSMNGSWGSRRVAQAFKHEEGAGCPSMSITDANMD
jgi:hypothetical protein